MRELEGQGEGITCMCADIATLLFCMQSDYEHFIGDFSAYVSSLPPHARPHLEVQLDWDQDIVEIAHHMLGWEEKLCSHLGLTEVDVHDIKAVHGSKPELQRYWCNWTFLSKTQSGSIHCNTQAPFPHCEFGNIVISALFSIYL